MEGIQRRSTWRGAQGRAAYAARRCASAKFSGSERIVWRSERGNPIQDFIHGFLDSSVGFMKFARRL